MESQTMSRQMLVIALLSLAPLGASAYQTGSLTCDNIGQLAGQTLAAKQSGISQDIYVSLLNEKLSENLPGNAQIERKLVANITTIIYQNDLPAAMKPADAYAVFRQDCLRGLAEDDAKG
jgi:hypothetical protein